MSNKKTLSHKIIKAIGILIGVPIGLIILAFVAIMTYQYFSQNNYSKIIKSSEFKNIETLVLQKPNLKNVAILSDTNFIVINGIIINRKNKTFGPEPILGFNINYYSEGNKNKYETLDSLLKSISEPLTATEINELIGIMNSLELTDIQINNDSCNKVVFRWTTSAMWGEEGIIKTDCRLDKSKVDQRTKIKEISKGYYKFNR